MESSQSPQGRKPVSRIPQPPGVASPGLRPVSSRKSRLPSPCRTIGSPVKPAQSSILASPSLVALTSGSSGIQQRTPDRLGVSPLNHYKASDGSAKKTSNVRVPTLDLSKANMSRADSYASPQVRTPVSQITTPADKSLPLKGKPYSPMAKTPICAPSSTPPPANMFSRVTQHRNSPALRSSSSSSTLTQKPISKPASPMPAKSRPVSAAAASLESRPASKFTRDIARASSEKGWVPAGGSTTSTLRRSVSAEKAYPSRPVSASQDSFGFRRASPSPARRSCSAADSLFRTATKGTPSKGILGTIPERPSIVPRLATSAASNVPTRTPARAGMTINVPRLKAPSDHEPQLTRESSSSSIHTVAVPKLNLDQLLKQKEEEQRSTEVYTVAASDDETADDAGKHGKKHTHAPPPEPQDHFYFYPKTNSLDEKKTLHAIQKLPSRELQEQMRKIYGDMILAKQNCEAIAFRGHRLLDQLNTHHKEQLQAATEREQQIKDELRRQQLEARTTKLELQRLHQQLESERQGLEAARVRFRSSHSSGGWVGTYADAGEDGSMGMEGVDEVLEQMNATVASSRVDLSSFSENADVALMGSLRDATTPTSLALKSQIKAPIGRMDQSESKLKPMRLTDDAAPQLDTM